MSGSGKRERCAWLLGWATPSSWFEPFARRAYPDGEHVFFAATPDGLADLASSGAFDVVAGYSLGSLLLLDSAASSIAAGEIALLAPIFGFPRERDLGGKVFLTQLKALARWLRRDRAAALNDFYFRAGLNVRPDDVALLTTDELIWGLEQLEKLTAPIHLPNGSSGWIGDGDPLLDGAFIAQHEPRVRLVRGGTHHPETLIQAWAAERRTQTVARHA